MAHPGLARLLPSARSLLAGFAAILLGVLCYVVARDTSVFAVRSVDVEGAPPLVARQVRDALRADMGASLLTIDRDAARQRVLAVPTVAAASLDRAFPHTLRITVLPERPVAVARQGADAWLLSARGRVMARLQRGQRPRLPRLWIAQGPTFVVGGTAPVSLRAPLAALAPVTAAHLPALVASVRSTPDELTLLLRSGIELRLGDADDVRLKLAVAAKVLPLMASGTRYLDVSVPERPVAGSIVSTPSSRSPVANAAADQPQTAHTASDTTLNSKVEVQTSTSTGP